VRMAAASLKAIAGYCDQLLRTSEIKDYDGAVNGLQVENAGRVTRIAAAVDATLSTIKLAIAQKADLLLVHHGLFWSPTHPWTGKRYDLIRQLMQSDLAVYSSHLPLDLHPRFGNNAQLAATLKFKQLEPFFSDKGQSIGLQTRTKIARDELGQKLHAILGGAPTILPGGPSVCRRIGIVTGGAGSHLKTAASEGVDTFITGEGPHWTYALAEELGINVLYGGHYATETFGVKALAKHLSQKFKIDWCFIHYPTGL
jgi:dinuclear metal center YbgI/SA1388 family protein